MFKGPSIFPGYFKNHEKTEEAFPDGDGWFRTGDVGLIMPNGSMKIVDRAKNIFKLAQGEYIAPEKLENVYIQSKYVAQIWIHGDSLKDYCIDFVVVDEIQHKQFAEEKKMAKPAALASEELRSAVYADMMLLATTN